MAVLEANVLKGKQKVIAYFFLPSWFSSIETLRNCTWLTQLLAGEGRDVGNSYDMKVIKKCNPRYAKRWQHILHSG